MKKLFVLVALVSVMVSSAAEAIDYDDDLESGARYYAVGAPVEITLVNRGESPVTMGETWDLSYLDGDGSAFYQWPNGDLGLDPGERRTWIWDQRVNQCYGECQNVREGDPALPGRYEVTTTLNGNPVFARFTIGQFFTLGFRHRPKLEFVVFVATQEEIDQMTEEAAKPDDEKRLITSGIVRKGKNYNPDWNFTMGPRSIELGEVFIEVCDGSPRYVQRHRDEWLGERWCPWSSYVKRVGD